MRGVAEKEAIEGRDWRGISLEERCTQVLADGRRCKQRRWRGQNVCFQHDPEAAKLRKKAGRRAHANVLAGQPAYGNASAGKPRTPAGLMTVAEVQEWLARTLEELREKRITPGEAYAAGYLAQLALAALGAARRESKLDVKHFWEMVDLGAAIHKAVELAKERKKEKEAKEAEEAREAEEGEEAEESGDS